MSVLSNKPRKMLVLGWMARAGNAAFMRIDAFSRDGVSPPAGRSFARFCAVFQESVKKIRCRSAAAGGSGHSRRVPGFTPRCARTSPCRTSSGRSVPRMWRAIPPTPRPRGRLSVLAFRAPAQRSGGERRDARLARLLAGENGVASLAAAVPRNERRTAAVACRLRTRLAPCAGRR